jgi:hypothetical protein
VRLSLTRSEAEQLADVLHLRPEPALRRVAEKLDRKLGPQVPVIGPGQLTIDGREASRVDDDGTA